MKTKSRINISFFIAILFLLGCSKEVFEPASENFQAKSFISNIKSFDIEATYQEDLLPVDTSSKDFPYVTLQSWIVKGKDILVSITVPDDAETLYFGASNSSAEYMGLNFSDDPRDIPSGYYQLDLGTIKAVKIEDSGYRNYQVVICSVEEVQADEFDLAVSYKSTTGYSNAASSPLTVKSIAPYQKNLKVGFQPLTGYTYSIKISAPSGKTVVFSYDKSGGGEVFDNSGISGADLSYDSGLGFNWIYFTDPDFGAYSLDARIEIEIEGGSQYIYLYLAVITEGRIEQVDLDADIFQTGANTAEATAHFGFSYFEELKSIFANILAYKPVNYEMLNPTEANCNNEILEIIPETIEESTGAGVRICKNCITDFKFSKITLEVLNNDYNPNELHFFLKLQSIPDESFLVWNNRNYNNLLLFGNQELEIEMPNFQNGYSSKDIWITTDNSTFENAYLTFIIKDNNGNILSEDVVKYYPINISILSLRGINTNILFGEFGHTWITIEYNSLKNSYGFWPESGSAYDFFGFQEERGFVFFQSGDFDDESIKYYDYTHDFYIYSSSLQSFYLYKETIDNSHMLWNLFYNCATFATTSVNLMGVDIPIMNWPNDVENWITQFEQNN
jgi:hypothetical protein